MAIRDDNKPAAPLSVRIEAMTRKDLPEVIAIERASFADPWAMVAFERELENEFSRTPVARDDQGRVVGYAVYWVAGPEYHILNIATRQDMRRRGVGRLLMNRIIAEALRDKVEFIALEVRPSNLAARTLYRKYGFVTVGTRPRYYHDGEDAEVMILHLRP